MEKHTFRFSESFETEHGAVLDNLELAYCTSGVYHAGARVVWACHALTASADVCDWWPDLFGDGKTFDPKKDFIICVNIPSSCYGSSGPLSLDVQTQEPYYQKFPQFTIRDVVRCFIALRKNLGIAKIDVLIGGSMGGYQALEWAILEKDICTHLILVATSARESAWGIAIHTAQRLAIETDVTFGENRAEAGARGMKAARAIGMLTYRSYEAFNQTQTDQDERLDDFRVSTYIHYQGDKLVQRFNAYSYWLLTKMMDSHHAGRGRGGVEAALQSITAKTLCIGITTDFLCPLAEQNFLAQHIRNASFVEINSPFGHDGFLVEGEIIGEKIVGWVGE
ncbi:MAG: homoserine O-acetyltransferase family protein [Bacteroidia bacterium]